MKKMILTFVLTACFSTSVLAALPPWSERAREFAAVAQDGAVIAAMQGHLIESITYTGGSKFNVDGERCTVIAQLVDLPSPGRGWAGARRFKVEVVQAIGCNSRR